MSFRQKIPAMAALSLSVSAVIAPFGAARADVSLNLLTDLSMAPNGTDFYDITVPSTGQLLTHIAPSVWQGNADIYPIDPTGQTARDGHYWSQFLMIGTDPANNQRFLTDRVESEGENLQSFNVIQSAGKVIEYQGTWTFRNLFTTTATHWVWVDGNNEYHRVQVSMDVTSKINNVQAIWTELFGNPDVYQTITTKTRSNGVISMTNTVGTNQHYLSQYDLARNDWLAWTNPSGGQKGSIARVELSNYSSINPENFVTPIWADFSNYDNIELHAFRSSGQTLQAGTHFEMDNLLITDPSLTGTSWIDPAVARAQQWIGLIGPSVNTYAGTADSKFFIASSGRWDVDSSWDPNRPNNLRPDANDTAFIHAGRTASIVNDVQQIGTLRLADFQTGTLIFQNFGALNVVQDALIGLGTGANSGTVSLSAGSLTVNGDMWLSGDADDSANVVVSGNGMLQVLGSVHAQLGNSRITQSGGTVSIGTNLNWGEGVSPTRSSIYTLNGGALGVGGTLTVASGGTVNFNAGSLTAGTISAAGGQLILSAGHNKVVSTTAISASSGGKIDLADNDAVVDYQFGSPAASIRALLNSGSLTSSAALAGKMLGYGDNKVLGFSTFDGRSVNPTSVLIKYTYGGDADLNGMVDTSDFLALAAAFGKTGKLWTDGDFNYDGVVNALDFNALASDFGKSMAPIAPTFAPLVPEPSSTALILCGAIALGSRRLRSN